MNFSQARLAPHDYEGDGLVSVLEAGIRSLQHGLWKESFALFTLARIQPDATSCALTDTLNALLASLQRCWEAQQVLHDASRRFVEAETEQGLQLRALQYTMRDLPGQPAPSHNGRASHSVSQEEKPEQLGASMTSFPVGADSQAEKQELGLTISCFGHFTVKRGLHIVNLGSNRNGQIILRYLSAQPQHSASKDTLMGLIWPDLTEEGARRRLQVAISAIRCALNEGYLQEAGGGYIIYQEPCYLLNPAIPVHTDVREFVTLWKTGQYAEDARKIACFEQACALYTAPFWSMIFLLTGPTCNARNLTGSI